jgi:hypothetical protein
MTDEELKALAGLTVEEARRQVEARGLHFRVVSEDGTSFPATMDYRIDRVNVHIMAGTVTRANLG